MLGGPLGAVLGAALGHNFDRGLSQSATRGPADGGVERVQSAFFTAVFSMMGHVAKADGVVTKGEIDVAESVMRQIRLNPLQKKVAIKLFEQGKHQNFPVGEVLEQFRRECQRRRSLMQMFMEILVITALADGRLEDSENRILRNTAQTLGFSSQEYQDILRRSQAQSHYQQEQASGMQLADAYQLLGLTRNASDAEVKKAYRRQMNQHHPDKLVSKGLPQEMIDIANQKAQDIRAAYDLIKSSRKG